MRTLSNALLLFLVTTAAAVGAELSGKVIKVLPHYLDLNQKHALSPSLYDRDAYQAVLRENPDQRSGVRFDIQWKAKRARNVPLQLRLELLTTRTEENKPSVIQKDVMAKSAWGRWTAIELKGDAYKELGEIIAWRVTLWHGDRLVSDRRSFLW